MCERERKRMDEIETDCIVVIIISYSCCCSIFRWEYYDEKNTICLHRMKREKKHIHTRDSMSRAQERSRKKT